MGSLPALQPGEYRHNKSGNIYEVIGVALHTETGEPLVVYKALYETLDATSLFARPYSMFVEKVELRGEIVPRFQRIES